jgi:tetratricopeptide (TPR) repeat protein
MLVARRVFEVGLLLASLAVLPPTGTAADLASHDFGAAGVLTLRKMPPCVAKHFGTAYDRCLVPRPGMDVPSDTRIKTLMDRAIVLIYLRRWPEAQQELDDAIIADPHAIEPRHLAARLAITAYMERHDPNLLSAAQVHTSAASKLAPRNADVRATGAFFVQLRGQDDDAIRAYSHAIALQPSHAFALGQRAKLHAAQGRLPQALEDYNSAIAATPGDLYLRRGRAQLLTALDRPREALADFDFVIQQMPHDFLAYSARAGIHRRLGNLELALEDLTTLILGPRSGIPFATGGDQLAGFLIQRAMVLADLQRGGEAAADMVRAAELGGRQKILRIQIYLRRQGYSRLPVDGTRSDALSAAIEGCFADFKCRAGLAQDT